MTAAGATASRASWSTAARDRFSGSSGAPIYAVLGVIVLVCYVLIGARFVTPDNFLSIIQRSVALGVVAAGQTVAILVGSIDLSVVYLISVVAVITAEVMQGDPNRIVLAVAVVVAIGAIVGLVNGLIITKLRVNAFVATLGVSLILRGLLTSRFDNFAGAIPQQFQFLGYSSVGPLPYSVLLLGLVVGAIWFLLRYTRIGHHVYAVGGSEETARLSGVRSHRVIIGAHLLCSFTAVLTGLYLASRVGGNPQVGPNGAYDLESIAAVVVGGTALAGGRGGVLGTLAGVLILAVLDNVFNLLQVNPFYKDIIRGVIIVAAVAVYALRTRRMVTA